METAEEIISKEDLSEKRNPAYLLIDHGEKLERQIEEETASLNRKITILSLQNKQLWAVLWEFMIFIIPTVFIIALWIVTKPMLGFHFQRNSTGLVFGVLIGELFFQLPNLVKAVSILEGLQVQPSPKYECKCTTTEPESETYVTDSDAESNEGSLEDIEDIGSAEENRTEKID